MRHAEFQHRHDATRTDDADELADGRGWVVDVAKQVRHREAVERCVGERQRLGSPFLQLDLRAEPAGRDPSPRDGEHLGAPVDPDHRAAVLPLELEGDGPGAGRDVEHPRVRPDLEPRDEEASPAGVLAEREQPGIAVVRRPERREERRRDAAAPLGGHGIESTILPSCSPRSRRSWAARVSASGKTESTWTRARPLRTSSYAPRKSSRVPIVEP